MELPSGEVLFHVEGHTAVVTAVAFCRHVPHLLVTAAEDRTFKVGRDPIQNEDWEGKKPNSQPSSAFVSADKPIIRRSSSNTDPTG